MSFRGSSSNVGAPPGAAGQRAELEQAVLAIPHMMRFEDDGIDLKEFENTDIVVKDIMRRAKAREARTVTQLQSLQRACMWETIIAAQALVDCVVRHQRKDAAMSKLRVTILPMVMRRLAKRARHRRRFADGTGDAPPRPTATELVRTAEFIFGGLPVAFVADCARAMECLVYNDRELIARPGEHSSDLLVIGAGKCTVDRHDGTPPRTAGVGDSFGNVLDVDIPHSASYFARGECAVWRLTTAAFAGLQKRWESLELNRAIAKCTADLDAEAVRTHFPITRRLLGMCAVLRDVEPVVAMRLAPDAEPCVHNRGDVIFAEDDTTVDHPYVMICLSGELSFRRAARPHDVEVQAFGIDNHQTREYGLVFHIPHVANSTADATCTVTSENAKFWRISRRRFLDVMLCAPAVALSLLEEATALRLKHAPHITRELLGAWQIFHHAPPHRLERMATKAGIRTYSPAAFIVGSGQQINCVYVAVSGKVARRPNGDAKAEPQHFSCCPKDPSTWVRIGGEWEALGLGEQWRDSWRAETEVDAWSLSLQDIRNEYLTLTVEHQQRALLAARKDLMAAKGLANLPRVHPRSLATEGAPTPPAHASRGSADGGSSGRPSIVEGDRSAPRPPRAPHPAGDREQLVHGSTARTWIDATKRGSVSITLPVSPPPDKAEGAAARMHEREAAFAKESATVRHRPAAPVSATAKAVMRRLDQWHIAPRDRLAPNNSPPPAAAATAAPANAKPKVDLAGFTATDVAAVMTGRDCAEASAVVRVPEQSKPFASRPGQWERPGSSAVAPARRQRWPEPSTARQRSAAARYGSAARDRARDASPRVHAESPDRRVATSAGMRRYQKRFAAGILAELSATL